MVYGSRLTVEEIEAKAEASDVRCADPTASKKMMEKIKEAVDKGDSLGGIFEIIVSGPPVGLGSYIQWDKRINSRLSKAIMGIHAIKGVEIGLGFDIAKRYGSEVMMRYFMMGISFTGKRIMQGELKGE